jgi:hypothetical protein
VRHCSTLLHILAWRIIVDADGKNVDYELKLPFVYLRSLIRNLSTPANGEGRSEHVPLGAQKSVKTSQNSESLEESLAGLRFEQQGKLVKLHFDQS